MRVVVVGLGYVGLPVAMAAAKAGHFVTGLDSSQNIVDRLNRRESHIPDVASVDLKALSCEVFEARSELQVDHEFDVAVICVPTPLGSDGLPDLSFVESAARSLGRRLVNGSTVILESTTYPGTTQEVVLPILEHESGLKAGRDFHLAYSPERIDPGNDIYRLENTPKVVGGLDATSLSKATEFYGSFIEQIVPVKGLREAETAKLLENTYRHINIALVNEMAMFCHELGIDIWQVIDAASTKPFGFQAFYPGPGVGGHCIPIDPNYLSYKVKADLGYPFQFVEMAQSINTRMPGYVFGRARDVLNNCGLALKGARVGLVGMSYKKDSSDVRESPAVAVANLFIKNGSIIEYFDPMVPSVNLKGLQLTSSESIKQLTINCDLVVVLTAHSSISLEELVDSDILVFDATNSLPGLSDRITTL